MSKVPSSEQVQVNFRMPADLRERIKEIADENHRSMNSEIVLALTLWVEKSSVERSIEAEYTPGSLTDAEHGQGDPNQQPEPRVNFIRSMEDVDAVVDRITRETSARLRSEMKKILAGED